MTWLTPLLAGVVAAVAIPALLILYFLKLRRREVEISTTLPWKKAIEDLRANAPFQRLRRNILLLLQLLALATVLLALAQPETAADAATSGRSVILIDRSASMGARDGESGRTRLEQAKEEAREFVRSLREPGLIRSLRALGAPAPSDEAMVIAFDSGAQVVQPFTANKRALLAAIDAVEQSDAPTSLDEALRLAGAYAQPVLREDVGLVSVATAPVHLWTDGRIADASDLKPGAETPIVYHPVGRADAANVGIVSIGATRQFDRPARVSVFVGLQSAAPRELAVDAELSVDGVVAAVKRVVLPPVDPATQRAGEGSGGGVVFEFEQDSAALLRVRLRTDDADRTLDLLEADNTAWLAVPPAKRASVLLVTPGSLYLQYALEGLNLARLEVMSPAQFASAPDSASAYDAVVLDGEASVAGLRSLPAGRYLALGAPAPLPGVEFTGDAAPTVILHHDREHPALKNAGLERLSIARSRTLALTGAARELARGERGTLIAETTDAGVDALVLSFDPAQSDWPFDVGFVLFLAEAVRALAGTDGAALPAHRPGEIARVALPPGASSVTLHEPDGSTAPLQRSPDGAAHFGPVRRAGLYAVRWDGAATGVDTVVSGRAQRAVAVNLTDPFESDVRAEPTITLSSRTVDASSPGGSRNARRSLWPWLLLGCIALLTVEWWVYNRRIAL